MTPDIVVRSLYEAELRNKHQASQFAGKPYLIKNESGEYRRRDIERDYQAFKSRWVNK